MAVYLISYDLKEPGQKYTALAAKIKALGDYKKPLESFWFVKSNLTATEISNTLWSCMDSSDYLLVAKFNAKSGERQGMLDKTVWAWLDENV